MAGAPLDAVGPEATALVRFVSETSLDDVPDPVVERSKLVLLDTVGSLLAASDDEFDPGRKLAAFVEEAGGRPQCSVVGYDARTSPENAALANATMGYFCDLDAHHVEAITHTPAVTVPSALAAGEREAATGEEFLLATILGVEVSTRVSLALNPDSLYEQGFHPTPISGCFGAAMAAGKLFGLDAPGLANALGLAQTQASGLLAWKEEPTESLRPFNPGIAARNGVTAARLATHEFGSPVDPFDGDYDVFRAFSNGREHVEALLDGLGERYTITEHAFKQYSSVAFSHPGLDALLEIVAEHDVEPAEIRRIEIRFPATGAELIDGTDLNSHSLQYVLAIAAIEGEVLIDDVVADRGDEPAVRRLMDAVEVVRDEELDHLFPERYTSIITVETAEDSYTERIDHAKGTRENPFDRGDIEAKFRKLTAPTTSEDDRERIVETVTAIEDLDDVNDLGDLLR